MNNELTTFYINFIKQLIPKNIHVNLVQFTDNGIVNWYTKPCGRITVPIEILETYNRSIKFSIKFYKYEKHILLYINSKISPDTIINNLNLKISKEVNNTLIKNNDVVFLSNKYNEAVNELNEHLSETIRLNNI